MKRSLHLLVAALAILALPMAGCAGTTTTTTGGSAGSSSASAGQTPEAQITAMVEKFYAAANSKDVGGVKALITSSSYDTLATQPERVIKYENDPPITVTVEKPVVEGDGATVTAVWKQGTDAVTDTLVLAKENGAWKVDLNKSQFAVAVSTGATTTAP
jgi:hypothetical protein